MRCQEPCSNGRYVMHMTLRLPFLLLLAASLHAEDIMWQLHYEAKSLPVEPWKVTGTPKATIEAEGLRLTDDDKAFANFRAAWKPSTEEEIIVEVVAKVLATTGSQKNKTSASLWPRRPLFVWVLRAPPSRGQG